MRNPTKILGFLPTKASGFGLVIIQPFNTPRKVNPRSFMDDRSRLVLKGKPFYSRASRTWYEKKSPWNFGVFGIQIFHLEGTGKTPQFFLLLNPSNMIRMTTASSSWTRLPTVSNPSWGEAVEKRSVAKPGGKFQLSFRPTTRCSTASSSCNCSWSSRCFHCFFSWFFVVKDDAKKTRYICPRVSNSPESEDNWWFRIYIDDVVILGVSWSFPSIPLSKIQWAGRSVCGQQLITVSNRALGEICETVIL